MTSPLDPASPASSVSTESIDDVPGLPSAALGSIEFTPSYTGTATLSGKRRLPVGGMAGSSNRDPKTRRREDGGSRKAWPDGKEGGRHKEEFLDVQLAEYLRRSALRIF